MSTKMKNKTRKKQKAEAEANELLSQVHEVFTCDKISYVERRRMTVETRILVFKQFLKAKIRTTARRVTSGKQLRGRNREIY